MHSYTPRVSSNPSRKIVQKIDKNIDKSVHDIDKSVHDIGKIFAPCGANAVPSTYRYENTLSLNQIESTVVLNDILLIWANY